MASISFSHFVLGIVLITLLGLRDCDAHSNRGIKIAREKAGDGNIVSEEKEMSNRKEIFDAVPVAAEEESSKFGERKFMMNRRQLRNEVKRAKETNKVNGEASKISGASSAGNCNDTLKRELKMESKLSNRSVRHMKINPSGFMALNADYHMARPHPPKNN